MHHFAPSDGQRTRNHGLLELCDLDTPPPWTPPLDTCRGVYNSMIWIIQSTSTLRQCGPTSSVFDATPEYSTVPASSAVGTVDQSRTAGPRVSLQGGGGRQRSVGSVRVRQRGVARFPTGGDFVAGWLALSEPVHRGKGGGGGGPKRGTRIPVARDLSTLC